MTFEDRRDEPSRQGVGRWPGLRIAMLSLDDGRIRTWINVQGSESSLVRRGSQIQNATYVFGKGPRHAVSGGRLALVDTERFSVRFIDLDGGSTRWILRRDEPPREVTSDHVDAWVEWAISVTRHPEGTAAIVRSARETPMASTLPVLESLYLDAVGNLWVEPYSVFGTEMPPFQVYAPDGSWLGSVAVPARARDREAAPLRVRANVRDRGRLHPRCLARRTGRRTCAVVRIGEGRWAMSGLFYPPPPRSSGQDCTYSTSSSSRFQVRT